MEVISKQVEKFSVLHLCSSLKDIKRLYSCSVHFQQLLKTTTNNFTFLPSYSGGLITKTLPCQFINWLKVRDARNATINWFYGRTSYFKNNHLMDKKCISSLLVFKFTHFCFSRKSNFTFSTKKLQENTAVSMTQAKKKMQTLFFLLQIIHNRSFLALEVIPSHQSAPAHTFLMSPLSPNRETLKMLQHKTISAL